MSRTPARFTQSDIARCIRAVQQCEADMRVKVELDGSIVIERDRGTEAIPDKPVEARAVWRL